MYDVPIGTASQSRISETISQDRDLRQGGLETFASRSRGTLFRVVANPQYVFDRLRSEISAHYMLGVEPTEKDRDGKPHQIRVQVSRSGVQIRARRQVQYTVRTPNTWSREVLMGRVLRSPAPSTELPMRLSSYVYRDADAGKVKLVLAAEIDPETMEKGLDLGVGFARLRSDWERWWRAVRSGRSTLRTPICRSATTSPSRWIRDGTASGSPRSTSTATAEASSVTSTRSVWMVRSSRLAI